MKKTLLTAIIGLTAIAGFSQTATNFTCNDCSGTSRTLFTELEAGKVIVLVWPMPCGTCIGPSQSAYSTAQSFSSSYPGRVLFWMADDYANTSCATLSSWAASNGMSNSTKFSNAAINMNDYGSTGMPKVVILGGASHTVFYNADDVFSSSAMSTAITNALNASTGVAEQEIEISDISVYPNPADNTSALTYFLPSASEVTAEVFNLVGEKTKTIFTGVQHAGKQRVDIDPSDLNNGIYFVKLRARKFEKTIKLSVSH
jgi:hypothetical protein